MFIYFSGEWRLKINMRKTERLTTSVKANTLLDGINIKTAEVFKNLGSSYINIQH